MDAYRQEASKRAAAPAASHCAMSGESAAATGVVLVEYDDQGRVVRCVTHGAPISETSVYQVV